MIGKLSGRLEHVATDHVLVDVAGVGYIIHVSERTVAQLPAPGDPVALYTELVVREDLMQLFGFPTLAEKEWHRLLTSVQGIGARGALAILGTLGAEGVGRAISLGDAAAIRAAPGIGPKTANRVVLELRGKAPAVMALGAAGAAQAMGPAGAGPQPAPAPAAPPGSAAMAGDAAQDAPAVAQADALSALVNLGYQPGEAAAAIARAGSGDAAELIRSALRALAPRQ